MLFCTERRLNQQISLSRSRDIRVRKVHSDVTDSKGFVLITYLYICCKILDLLLIIFGGDSLKTFSMALLIGMIFGSYSSVFMASPLVYLMRKYRKPKNKTKKEEEKRKKNGKTVNGYDENEKVLV